jgi:hypothetical protein
MAQSPLTVTPPSPTPPTNFSCTGATPPNPPNYTKNTYADWADNTTSNTAPPPFYDDGAAGPLTVFAPNVAALASGSGATAGGTEGNYPGAGGVTPPNVHFMGAVPASTSVPHEAAGTEVVVTAPGSRPEAPTVAVSVLGNYTATPSRDHASSLSPANNATLTSITPGSSASGSGTTTLSVTGTGFTKQSVIHVNGVPQTTTFNSATSLTAPTVTKKTSAGPWPVVVITGGVVTTAPQTWTFT